jgi:hypothetical protein
MDKKSTIKDRMNSPMFPVPNPSQKPKPETKQKPSSKSNPKPTSK